MELLSSERIESGAPFDKIGVDCFGFFKIKERRTELKKWGIVFTCFYSRAIHIEVLADMSTDSFVNAMSTLIHIRGLVSMLYSDHGTNFMGAKNYYKRNNIKHKTTTPLASHQRGVWERQIRAIRAVLDGMRVKFVFQFPGAKKFQFMYMLFAVCFR